MNVIQEIEKEQMKKKLPEFRVGIHLGTVVVEDDFRSRNQPGEIGDIKGLQADTTARVMGLAEGGQILCSRAVFDDARQALRGTDLPGIGPLVWHNHGPYLLKGVEDPFEICEVGEEGIAAFAKPVGGAKAKGICGSGLISAVAELLHAGLLEPSGKLVDPDDVKNPQLKERFFRLDRIMAFRLTSAGGEEVYISQKDIRELQLAKGAIRTGIDMLLEETGVEAGSLKKIRLAGNFGSGVDIGKTIRIGLIPEVEIEKVDVVGNAALRGASLVLVSREYRQKAVSTYRGCRFLELAAKPEFQTRFASSMFF